MMRVFSPWAGSDRPGAHTVRSADGALRLELQLVDAGVYMQRELRRQRAGRVTQSSIFASRDAFRRWCDADTLRFQYPIVHAKLLRVADRLFDEHDAAYPAG